MHVPWDMRPHSLPMVPLRQFEFSWAVYRKFGRACGDGDSPFEAGEVDAWVTAEAGL